MITVLTGDNSFELTRAMREIVRDFDGDVEKIDGSELELSALPNLLQGGTLFATERLVIVRDLSENKNIWSVFSEWIDKVSDDVHLVLVEPALDKRTKTYKDLQKKATVKTFTAWNERDTYAAEKWLGEEAENMGVKVDKKNIRRLVERAGVDQWKLFHALEKLAVLDAVGEEDIDRVVDASPTENVFNLFDSALKSDKAKVHDMIRTLELTEDAFKTQGLLSGQVVQLATLVVSDKKSDEVAKDIGAHPFVMSKLAPHAKKLTKNQVAEMVRIFADTDVKMKSTGADPWMLIENELIKTASL